MRLPLAIIAARSRNGVVGRAGQLPWYLPEDRAHFRHQTLGHAVIMGRGTWDERGSPLDGRRNIVVSRSGQVSGAGREVVPSLESGISRARSGDAEPMVIGGESIFRLALPYATRLILTELDFDVEGDRHFPSFDLREWIEVERRPGDRASYVTYLRPVDEDVTPPTPLPIFRAR